MTVRIEHATDDGVTVYAVELEWETSDDCPRGAWWVYGVEPHPPNDALLRMITEQALEMADEQRADDIEAAQEARMDAREMEWEMRRDKEWD